jgi:hypothetical protein
MHPQPLTQQQAAAMLKVQVANLERKQNTLKEAMSSLNAAIGHFAAFIKSPSLATVGLLAEGLRSMAASQLHGYELEVKFVHENLEETRAKLKIVESPIANPGGVLLGHR